MHWLFREFLKMADNLLNYDFQRLTSVLLDEGKKKLFHVKKEF